MSKILNIQELADSVLERVAEAEQEKTASEEVPESLKTEIGKALKEAADKVRGCSDEVTQEDIASLFKEAEKQSQEKIAEPKHPSILGDELRKLAQFVKTQGPKIKTAQLTQAAHMFNAAVGLAHLRSLQ